MAGQPASLDSLRELADRTRPVSLAADRCLPVLAPLEPLLAGEGLRRGSVVAVSGSTSLALALVAAATAAGSWCAAVGLPSLGLVAASELGVALGRFPLVAAPRADTRGGGWAWVVAALLDALDLVLTWPAASVRPADGHRLVARAREQGAVLVVVGDRPWPAATDVRLTVARATWQGVGPGSGRLRARLVEVVSSGRGLGGRERRAALWLPAPDGGVAPADPHDASLHPAPSLHPASSG